MARLPVKVLPVIAHDTPMLLSAPPLAQRPPVKVLPDDPHREVAELAERPDRGAAEVRAGAVAAVAGEARVDDRQPPAADEDRAPAAAVHGLAGGVAGGEA